MSNLPIIFVVVEQLKTSYLSDGDISGEMCLFCLFENRMKMTSLSQNTSKKVFDFIQRWC